MHTDNTSRYPVVATTPSIQNFQGHSKIDMDPGDARTDVLDVLWLVVPWFDSSALRATRRVCSFAKVVIDDYVDHKTRDRAEAARMISAPCIFMIGKTDVTRKSMDHVYANPGAWQWVTTVHLTWKHPGAVPGAICQLARLEKLSASYNQLVDLPPEIGRLTRLRFLILDYNEFTEVPAAVCQLTQLEHLDLSNNHNLHTLPDEFERLTQLRYLNITETTALNPLPAVVGRLKNLRRLEANGNGYTTFPDAIANLTELRILYMNCNQMAVLPDTIGRLACLEVLNMSVNHLTTLHDGFAGLTRLQDLCLCNNRFEEIPSALMHLTQLRKLSMSRNLISTLPTWIGQLSGLTRLCLTNNRPVFRLPESMHNTDLSFYIVDAYTHAIPLEARSTRGWIRRWPVLFGGRASSIYCRLHLWRARR